MMLVSHEMSGIKTIAEGGSLGAFLAPSLFNTASPARPRPSALATPRGAARMSALVVHAPYASIYKTILNIVRNAQSHRPPQENWGLFVRHAYFATARAVT